MLPRQSSSQEFCIRSIPALFTVLLMLVGCSSRAAIPLALDSPTDFFTNIAARLLKSELNLDLGNLQIYPTNQYTPSVHRLLQVTANLYDSITNRALGLNPEYPSCPSVFRPLFRRVLIGTNTCIVIAGYREVTNIDMADPMTAPLMMDLALPNPPLLAFLPYDAPFNSVEKQELMVWGVPLVIGAKRGIPNFNEFSMQTQIVVSRLLEFRRAPGSSNGPVLATNQMYQVGISNTFGLEEWNSYLAAYPRDLRLVGSIAMTAVLTNETGAANVLFSNTFIQELSLDIPANSWNGWTTFQDVAASMVLPLGTTNGFLFLSNSTYINKAPWFIPLTHIFPASPGFYVPHWWLNLKISLLCVLVDTNANRIVDYVNLANTAPTLDVTSTLLRGNTATTNPGDYKNPANEWLTNRLGNSLSSNVPTYGIINQILVGLMGLPDVLSYSLDPYSGLDAESAVDGFRYNLSGFAPIFPKDIGKTFYKSNVFYAPFDPYRPIYIHTSWQANDPLVHYLASDFLDLSMPETNRVDFISHVPPLDNLDRMNSRYKPWGGNPLRPDPVTDFQIAVKDPGITKPDDWQFPSNQRLGTEWLGQVHRGTPWQSIFLKSTNILQQAVNASQGLLTWMAWTGNAIVNTNNTNLFGLDAQFTLPTNDWHLVGVLNNFFNTNDVRRLASPNADNLEKWESLLDGISVLTNTAPGQFTAVTMMSNSSQAAFIAQGLLAAQAAQPAGLFFNIGDILATPELSVASTWLGAGSNAPNDLAVETIPSQLLPRLRPDSIAVIAPYVRPAQIQFSGMDGYSYVVQVSSDLFTWTALSTNVPENGVFSFMPLQSNGPAQFYRSWLLP